MVVLAVVVGALALWKLKVLLALLFASITIAAAMRPGVEWLHKHRMPRPLGVAIHYLGLLGLLALFLSFVVPDMISQVQGAMAAAEHHKLHTARPSIDRALSRLETRLQHLPQGGSLIHPAVTIGEKALEVLVGIFFIFATAAYWLFERDRVIDLVASLVPRPKRKTLRDTWELMDLKLGAFVRGQLVMIALVSTLVSIGALDRRRALLHPARDLRRHPRDRPRGRPARGADPGRARRAQRRRADGDQGGARRCC